VTLTLAATNVGEIEAQGVDLKAGYSFSNDLGNFSANLTYTHVQKYEFSGVPGMTNGLLDTGVYDAAGTTGTVTSCDRCLITVARWFSTGVMAIKDLP